MKLGVLWVTQTIIFFFHRKLGHQHMIRNKNARIDECHNLIPRNCCVFGIGNQSSSTFSCICFPLFCLCLCEELLDRMASREVLNFVQGCKLNETLLKKLKIALQTINAVLKDAEVKQITNPEVRVGGRAQRCCLSCRGPTGPDYHQSFAIQDEC